MLRVMILGLLAPVLFAAETELKRPEGFMELMNEAAIAAEDRKFDVASEKVAAAEKLAPGDPLVLNAKAAILIEQRKFDEGERALNELLAKQPKFYPALYNKCEIRFLQKRYPEARAGFSELLENNPKDELARFKIFLCNLMEKQEEKAKEMLDSLPFPGNTPAYYYAHAAWDGTHGKPKEAKDWIRSAQQIFRPGQRNVFHSTLVELGLAEREKEE
jgi:tetratricopeptide (TPR) repeat protein